MKNFGKMIVLATLVMGLAAQVSQADPTKTGENKNAPGCKIASDGKVKTGEAKVGSAPVVTVGGIH